MSKYRVEVRNEGYLGKRYYPQYYTEKYFFGLFGGWKFYSDIHIDGLGFHSYEEVSFCSMVKAKNYLKMRKKSKIIKHKTIKL